MHARQEREHGVDAGVNAIIMSDVLYGIGLAEFASSASPCLGEPRGGTAVGTDMERREFICSRIKKDESRG
jgi:hypothetical protein